LPRLRAACLPHRLVSLRPASLPTSVFYRCRVVCAFVARVALTLFACGLRTYSRVLVRFVFASAVPPGACCWEAKRLRTLTVLSRPAGAHRAPHRPHAAPTCTTSPHLLFLLASPRTLPHALPLRNLYLCRLVARCVEHINRMANACATWRRRHLHALAACAMLDKTGQRRQCTSASRRRSSHHRRLPLFIRLTTTTTAHSTPRASCLPAPLAPRAIGYDCAGYAYENDARRVFAASGLPSTYLPARLAPTHSRA